MSQIHKLAINHWKRKNSLQVVSQKCDCFNDDFWRIAYLKCYVCLWKGNCLLSSSLSNEKPFSHCLPHSWSRCSIQGTEFFTCNPLPSLGHLCRDAGLQGISRAELTVLGDGSRCGGKTRWGPSCITRLIWNQTKAGKREMQRQWRQGHTSYED